MARYSQSGYLFKKIVEKGKPFIDLVHCNYGYGKMAMKEAIMMYGCCTESTAYAVIKKMDEAGMKY